MWMSQTAHFRYIIQIQMSNVQGKAPLQLIRYSEGRFEVPSETAEFLRGFTRPLALVTIVGKYRTGKSLLLNKVLLKQPSFSVSPTINSCTKGLWLSKQTLRNQQQQTDVLVVDTEGFGAPEETDQYNQKILLFAMLLSSYFIYNSVGSIDENSLNSLNLVAQIARQILKNNSKDQKAEQEAPAFLWLLRDFALNLVDKNGTPIQPREYLEQALELQKGSSDAIEGKNKIRRMLKHFFKDRDCFTLVRPVESEQHLQNLLLLPDSSFRAEFLEQAGLLRSKVLKKARAKRIKGRPLSGQLLLQLANNYVQVVNRGELPNFQLSYKQVLKVQAQRSAADFIRSCGHKLSTFSSRLLSEAEIEIVQAQLMKDLEVRFKQLGLEGELKGISESTKGQIEQMIATFKQDNEHRCKERCASVWANLYENNRQFQDGEEIQSYFRELLQELKAEMEAMSNPVNQHYMTLLVQEHQIKQLHQFIHKAHQRFTLQLEGGDQRIKELELQISEKSNAFNRLQDSNHQLTRQINRLTSKLQELEQVKDVEIGYLKQQSTEHSREISQLLSKLQGVSTEAEQLKASVSESHQVIDELTRSYRQSQEDRRLIEKELQITKLTLQSKEEENRLLKNQLSETRLKLQCALQKQSQILSRHQDEVSMKMIEYSSLCRKNENQAEQLNKVNTKVVNLQLQLQQNMQALARERQIYEQMFDSLRESLRAESSSRLELIETNKNLSAAIKHLEHRSQQAQDKELILKDFKKAVKNASCLQCQHCSKFFVPTIFLPHLNTCLLAPGHQQQLKQQVQNKDRSQIEIRIKQTLVKEAEGKPYTEYVLELSKDCRRWSLHRKYKAFCDLHGALKAALPGVDLSDSSYIVNPQQASKKSLLIEERRKILQKYLQDLESNPFVQHHPIWLQFVEAPESDPPSLRTSPLKQNTSQNKVIEGSKERAGKDPTPEEFFRVWNERQIRGKESQNVKNKWKLALN